MTDFTELHWRDVSTTARKTGGVSDWSGTSSNCDTAAEQTGDQ